MNKAPFRKTNYVRHSLKIAFVAMVFFYHHNAQAASTTGTPQSWQNFCVYLSNPQPKNDTQQSVTTIIQKTSKSKFGAQLINSVAADNLKLCDITQTHPESKLAAGFLSNNKMIILNPNNPSAPVDLAYSIAVAKASQNQQPVIDYTSNVLTTIATQADATAKAAVVSYQLAQNNIYANMSDSKPSYKPVEDAVANSLQQGKSTAQSLAAGFNTFVFQPDTSYVAPASVFAINTIANGGKQQYQSFMNDTRANGTPGTSIDRNEFPIVRNNIQAATKTPEGQNYLTDPQSEAAFLQKTAERLDYIRIETKKQAPAGGVR